MHKLIPYYYAKNTKPLAVVQTLTIKNVPFLWILMINDCYGSGPWRRVRYLIADRWFDMSGGL
jgi:hypothetical protein